MRWKGKVGALSLSYFPRSQKAEVSRVPQLMATNGLKKGCKTDGFGLSDIVSPVFIGLGHVWYVR